jgi:hypothetical protein
MRRIFDHEKLDVLVAKQRCVQEEVAAGKDRLWSIVSMLVGLLRLPQDRGHRALTPPLSHPMGEGARRAGEGNPVI